MRRSCEPANGRDRRASARGRRDGAESPAVSGSPSRRARRALPDGAASPDDANGMDRKASAPGRAGEEAVKHELDMPRCLVELADEVPSISSSVGTHEAVEFLPDDERAVRREAVGPRDRSSRRYRAARQSTCRVPRPYPGPRPRRTSHRPCESPRSIADTARTTPS